jgi:signal transduction histidine kinase
MASLPNPPAEARSPRDRRRALAHHAAVSVAVCLPIAVVLTAVLPSPWPPWRAFLQNWLYAQCIGGCIQALIEFGRLGLAAWLRARRPHDRSLAAGWPGWRWFLPWLLVSTVAGYLLGASIADAIVGGSHVRSLFGGDLRPLVFLGVITVGVSLLTSYAFYTHSRLQAAEARSEAVGREAAEHQLRLLESQLEPHMLFNTLANLRVLIGLDPVRAQTMLDHLIAFLRATLRASQDRQHPLAVEFERVADYLALMRIRMGPRLAVDLDLPADLRDVPVPPLLLQPLVENAIRHGLEPTVAGGRLEVRARRDAAGVALVVADDGVGLPASPDGETSGPRPAQAGGGGFGLQQIRQRLATLHGDAASLDLRAGAGGIGTVACIRLPAPSVAATTTTTATGLSAPRPTAPPAPSP